MRVSQSRPELSELPANLFEIYRDFVGLPAKFSPSRGILRVRKMDRGSPFRTCCAYFGILLVADSLLAAHSGSIRRRIFVGG